MDMPNEQELETKLSTDLYFPLSHDTVDGLNVAPPGMYKTLKEWGILPTSTGTGFPSSKAWIIPQCQQVKYHEI